MSNPLKKSGTDLKNQRFLFLFDCLVSPQEAGTVGTVLDLDTPRPRVIFGGGGGGGGGGEGAEATTVSLTGRKYHATSRYMPLLFGDRSADVNVNDVFTSVVVFGDAEAGGGGEG